MGYTIEEIHAFRNRDGTYRVDCVVNSIYAIRIPKASLCIDMEEYINQDYTRFPAKGLSKIPDMSLKIAGKAD